MQYFGFFRIKGNHHKANKIVKTTPPSIANPPVLKLKKLDQLASPIQHDQILAPKIAVGIPIKQK